MKKILFLVFSIVFSNFSYSEKFPEIYGPQTPEWCVYDEWEDYGAGTIDLSYDYLQIKVPAYLIIGNKVSLKGDGRYLINKGDTIYFYDSIKGYLGKDDSNTDGNAYLDYTPSTAGQAQLWVMKSLPSSISYADAAEYTRNHSWNDHLSPPPPCSKKDVYFQHKPYVGPSGFTSFNIINGSMSLDFPNGFPLYYEVDWNSKAVRENVPSTITLYARYETSGARDVVGTVQVSQQRGTVSIRPSGYMLSNGKIRFYAQVNDGTHSSDEVFLGTFTRIDTMPSACAQVCPASLGPYRAQCQGTSGACNYRIW